MKKLICLLLVLCLCAGCGRQTAETGIPGTTPGSLPSSVSPETTAPTEAPVTDAPSTEAFPPVFSDGEIKSNTAYSVDGRERGSYVPAASAYTKDKMYEAESRHGFYSYTATATVTAGEAELPVDFPVDFPVENWPAPAAFLLTAKEWNDIGNPEEFLSFFNKEENLPIRSERDLNLYNLVKAEGLIPLSAVSLWSGETLLWKAVSDIYGRAVLCSPADMTGQRLTLKSAGEISFDFEAKDLQSFRFENEAGGPAAALDFMLMVDTTGSMGDELEYLKAELVNVIEAVYTLNPQMSIRVSINFYRDEGDEYVVRYFDFREDMDEVIRLMKEQTSEGGGDYPEAVHTALDNAVFGHEWREDAVKLCYLVLDAPPHTNQEYTDSQGELKEDINASLNKSIAGAAELGIRVIPVIASGAENDLELMGRSWAVATGGTYVYLTDHSGIGYSHHEPDVPDTELEFFNECLKRITADYCGLKYQSESPSPSPEPTEPETLPIEPTEAESTEQVPTLAPTVPAPGQ